MELNLYKLLGVNCKASREQIVKKFRALAKKHHPDAGGLGESAEKWKQIHAAYKILSDDAKRSRYDATGTVEEDRTDNSQAKVFATLSHYFLITMSKLLEIGASAEQEDVVKHMRECIKQNIDGMQQILAKHEKALRFLKASLKRFKTDQGENHFDGMLTAHIDAVGKMIESVRSQEEDAKQTLDYLKRFRFDFKPKEYQGFSVFDTRRGFIVELGPIVKG